MNAEATASSTLRLAALRSFVGHPLEQGLLLQQPMKAGFVPAQVYQWLSALQVWSGNVPYSATSKLAGLRFFCGQLVVSSHGSTVPLQHPTNLEPVVQTCQKPPFGQEGSKDWRGQRLRSRISAIAPGVGKRYERVTKSARMRKTIDAPFTYICVLRPPTQRRKDSMPETFSINCQRYVQLFRPWFPKRRTLFEDAT